MWIIPALTALLSTTIPMSPAPVDLAARIAAVAADTEVSCFEPAKGRASVPIRENYFTYSPVVGSVARGQAFFGRRVAGENKVLVLTPHAAGSIGLARFTFTREVAKERCAGERLYAPDYDQLQAWAPPLPGQVEAPRSPGRIFSAFGCYSTNQNVSIKADSSDPEQITIPKGQLFFGGHEDDLGHYGAILVVVDASGGAELGRVRARQTTRVPLSECAGAAAFTAPR